MKQIIFNAFTNETTIVDLPDIKQPTPQPTEPTLEERVAKNEADINTVIDVVAQIEGVVL